MKNSRAEDDRAPQGAARALAIGNSRRKAFILISEGQVEGRDELGVDGLVERAVRLSSLIPGSYRLRVTAGGGAGSATRELGFAVRDASP